MVDAQLKLIYNPIKQTDKSSSSFFGEASTKWLVFRKKAKDSVLLDFIEKNKNTEAKLQKDYLLLKNISHRNVVQVLDLIHSGPSPHLVFEPVRGGSLLNLLKVVLLFNEKGSRNVFSQIVAGVKYLHDNNISHGNICLENIFVSEKGTIKVSNFWNGSLRINMTKSPAVDYLSPEVLANTCSDYFKSDVWSLGVSLYIMSTSYYPYNASDSKEMLDVVYNQKLTFNFHKLSTDIQSLLKQMLTVDANDRPDCDEIITHPWMYELPPKHQETEESSLPLSNELYDGIEYEKNPLFSHLLNNPTYEMFVEKVNVSQKYVVDVEADTIEHKHKLYQLFCLDDRTKTMDFLQVILKEHGHKYERVSDNCIEARHRCPVNYVKFWWKFEIYKVIGLPLHVLNFYFFRGSQASFQEKISYMKEAMRNNLHIAKDNDFTRSRPPMPDDVPDKEQYFDVHHLRYLQRYHPQY